MQDVDMMTLGSVILEKAFFRAANSLTLTDKLTG